MGKSCVSEVCRNGRVPEKIYNGNLYKKYFVYGQQIHLSRDFYFMTEELWKFLFAIYGGGPIMKKVKEGNEEVFKID